MASEMSLISHASASAVNMGNPQTRQQYYGSLPVSLTVAFHLIAFSLHG